MSMFKTTLRIKTDTPEGRKALGYLRSRAQNYKSYEVKRFLQGSAKAKDNNLDMNTELDI